MKVGREVDELLADEEVEERTIGEAMEEMPRTSERDWRTESAWRSS